MTSAEERQSGCRRQQHVLCGEYKVAATTSDLGGSLKNRHSLVGEDDGEVHEDAEPRNPNTSEIAIEPDEQQGEEDTRSV